MHVEPTWMMCRRPGLLAVFICRWPTGSVRPAHRFHHYSEILWQLGSESEPFSSQASETKSVVNLGGVVNQRQREFWPGFSVCEMKSGILPRPPRLSREPESARPAAGSPQTPWHKAETQKRRERELSAFRVNRWVPRFRGKTRARRLGLEPGTWRLTDSPKSVINYEI
jgi:hypothetical protein